MEELKRIVDGDKDMGSGPTSSSVIVESPCEGLVALGSDKNDGLSLSYDRHIDPVYALQTMPDVHIFEAPKSIKSLATAITECEPFQQSLRNKAGRNSLTIHAVVPGMMKGQRNPLLKRRSSLVAQQVRDTWKRLYPAARETSKTVVSTSRTTTINKHKKNDERWLLQILMLSPDRAAVSLASCRRPFASHDAVWPNPHLPVGLARVDIEGNMPSSAYRKLLEAFACMGVCPSADDIVVDLGASPGGWTKALRLLSGCRVVAIDRSELDPKLMKDQSVKFVKGDAFVYEPPRRVSWMVSDVIAYPERVLELLESWCGARLADNLVVTMKFQGREPAWGVVSESIELADKYGYDGRAKHFFNNKNEVTLMLCSRGVELSTEDDEEDGDGGRATSVAVNVGRSDCRDVSHLVSTPFYVDGIL